MSALSVTAKWEQLNVLAIKALVVTLLGISCGIPVLLFFYHCGCVTFNLNSSGCSQDTCFSLYHVFPAKTGAGIIFCLHYYCIWAMWATHGQQGFFYMHHPTDRITHTTAFVTPVVEHWL